MWCVVHCCLQVVKGALFTYICQCAAFAETSAAAYAMTLYIRDMRCCICHLESICTAQPWRCYILCATYASTQASCTITSCCLIVTALSLSA
jgi:hypothetical protein